jgi:C-terminal processing protease CtpA/Prc
MKRRGVLRLFALGFVPCSRLVRAARENGWFGFAVSVEVEGSLSPTLRAAKIESVVPSSPAAVAGLVVGDAIVEVQGIVVAGAKAKVVRDAMQKSVGETLRLMITRGSSPPRTVTLTAAAKPPGA